MGDRGSRVGDKGESGVGWEMGQGGRQGGEWGRGWVGWETRGRVG